MSDPAFPALTSAGSRRRPAAWRAWAALPLLALCVAFAAAADTQRALVVGSEQDFPPFAVGMTDATAGGFTVDLWRAVAREQGLTYTIRVRPFDELLQGFKTGQVDVLLNLAKSDERRRFADFSATHVVVGGAVFARQGETRLTTEDDLAGKTLVVLKGDLAHEYALGKGWAPTLVDTAEQGLRQLAAGQGDAMLISKLTGLQTLRDHSISGVDMLPLKVAFSQRFAFAVPKGEVELLSRINEGLAVARTSGVYDRLYDTWFGALEPRRTGWRELWREAWPVGAVVVLIAAIAWGVALRRRLRRDRRNAAILRDSEERWKFALDGAGDGVWDVDLVSGTTLYSRRWKEILGYREDEIGSAADEWSRRIHPDDLPRVLRENQACIDGTADSFVSEFRMRAKDGRWLWILDRGKVVARSPAGRALRMIGTHTDISARKAGEAEMAAIAIERKRSEEALRESEARLSEKSRTLEVTLERMEQGVMMVNAERVVEVCNRRAIELLELPPALMASRPDFADVLAYQWASEEFAHTPEDLREFVRAGGILDQPQRYERKRPNGRVIEVLSVPTAGGGVLRTYTDMTERNRAEATRAVLEAQLLEARRLEAIGTLAGGIAHDFNNIMGAILGNVALARQDVGEGHPAQRFLEQINKAGQRARSLVQQILAFSRQQPNEFIGVSLVPLVDETVSMLGSMAGPSVQLRACQPAHKVAVLGNPTQLQQVLMNLATNAWHALEGGAGQVEIGLEACLVDAATVAPRPAGLANGAWAHLWVRDDGRGMDETTRRRIFEPFFTTKPVGQGTGLGLAVVHGIVESHGGSIEVTSAPGQGSRFDLYLPLVDHESGPVPFDALAAPARGAGQHVLYVDDDEVMALMVQSLLQRLGYRTTISLGAREAVEAVARDPAGVDLVVTDFNMPNFSGLDVVRALAGIRPDLPVVISSGYVSDELRARASDLGVRAVMQKEHTLEELGAVVHEALRRSP